MYLAVMSYDVNVYECMCLAKFMTKGNQCLLYYSHTFSSVTVQSHGYK